MQIKIVVSDPQVRKQYGGMKQFYIYSIKGQDQKGAFEIQRRYSDFDLLRSTIIKRWPGFFLPSLPSKVKLANSDEEFLQIRSLYLQKFLQQVAQKTLIWYSQQMQFFIRINNLACQKVLGNYSKVDYKEIVYRYSCSLKKFENFDQQKHKTQIQAFQKELQTLFLKIQELRAKGQEVFNFQRKYHKKYAKLLSTLFEGYESKVRQIQQKESLMLRKECIESREKVVDHLKQVPSHGIFQEIRRQKRQIMAFQQILQNRLGYQKEIKDIEAKIKDKQAKIQELRGGKQSFLSKIRKADTSVEIQTQQKSIQKYKQQLKTLYELFKYINCILAEEQIGFFKKERMISYYKMVKTLSLEQLKIFESQKSFWSLIANQNHHGFQIEQPPIVHIQEKKISQPQKQEVLQKQQLQEKESPRKAEEGQALPKFEEKEKQENQRDQAKPQQPSQNKDEHMQSEPNKQQEFGSIHSSNKDQNQVNSPKITEQAELDKEQPEKTQQRPSKQEETLEKQQ